MTAKSEACTLPDPLSELPKFSETTHEMARLTGRLMAPSLKSGFSEILVAKRVCAPIAAELLLALGRDADEVASALRYMIADETRLSTGEGRSLPSDLEASVREIYDEALAAEPESTLYRLDEKHVKWMMDFRMDIFHDESKHRGRPHVRVVLQDGTINISIEPEPKVLAGIRDLRGEAAAIKSVRENYTALLDFWNETRPDDQKLPPVAAKASTKTNAPKRKGGGRLTGRSRSKTKT